MLGNRDILLRKALVGLVLSANDEGGIDGRKKLQKIVYLTNSAGWNVINDYRFYHYGPYSEQLLSEVQNLERAELIEVEEAETPFGTPYYLHRITEEGRILLDELQNETEDEELVERTRDLARELNEYGSDQLELMASLYYLRRQRPTLGDEELVEELGRLKPQFIETAIRNAFCVFDIMARYTNNN